MSEKDLKDGEGFTFTNFLIIIVIICAVVLFVLWIIKPTETLQKTRDNQRFTDTTDITTAINLYLADGKTFNVTGLNNLTGYSSIDLEKVSAQKNDGTGWIKLDFASIASGAPITLLPIDPTNNDKYHYTFGVNKLNGTYEVNCVFEGLENASKMSSDNGNNPNVYEVGTDLTILP